MVYLRFLLILLVICGFVSLWLDIKDVLWNTNPIGVVLTAFIFFDTMVSWIKGYIEDIKLP